MKIKGLLLGMLACAAMVACTNEDIVENNNGGQPEKVKGNLSLVISSSSNSSRAGDNENSGTTDPGIESESTVTDAVIILNRLDDNGDLTQEEFGGYLTGAQLNKTTTAGATIYKPFFTLANSGLYKVLVVLNPTVAIEAIANNEQTTGKSKYEQIVESSYTTTGADIAIAAAGQFMMVNKEEITVNVESNNYENPTEQGVEVERVVSKINYVVAKLNNLYPLTVKTTDYAIAETISGYYIYPDNKAAHLTGLHKAKNLDNGNSDVWIHEGTNGTDRRAFIKTDETYGQTDEHIFTLLESFPKFEYYTKTTNGQLDWTVKLDKYALVNLSNSVYTARHLTDASWENLRTLGLLGANNMAYMVDPNSMNKNSESNYDQAFDSYFYNALKNVNADKVDEAGSEQTYFQDLPTENTNDNKEVGHRLAYCLENIVKKEKQVPALVTGIIFRGQIGDKDGNPVGTIYKCDNKFYTSIDAVKADNGADASYDTYENGHCYYYSSDICHNKGDQYMDKAIMRNNIYVLKVTGFEEIGGATIEIDPSGEEIDNNFYLQLSAKILPWVVRFNNIEF